MAERDHHLQMAKSSLSAVTYPRGSSRQPRSTRRNPSRLLAASSQREESSRHYTSEGAEPGDGAREGGRVVGKVGGSPGVPPVVSCHQNSTVQPAIRRELVWVRSCAGGAPATEPAGIGSRDHDRSIPGEGADVARAASQYGRWRAARADQGEAVRCRDQQFASVDRPDGVVRDGGH